MNKERNMTNYYKPTTSASTSTSASYGSPTTQLTGNRIAICCGINDYIGTNNDLNGCVNDSIEWAKLLTNKFGYKVRLLKDSQVTWENVVNGLKELVSKSGEGIHCVFTYSGHGSNVPSTDENEGDKRDECLCLHDKWLIDNDIRYILKDINPKGRFTFISDSCHSATVTRQFLSTLNEGSPYAKPRFITPPTNTKGLVKRVKKSKSISGQEVMKEILISGCLESEYSYDSKFNNKYMGAMSYNAINIINETPNITYSDFHLKLSKILPSKSYPQTPQLEGKQENKKLLMFI